MIQNNLYQGGSRRATIGTMSYEPVLKILKYKTRFHTSDEGNNLPIYYNLINSTPLQHIDKQLLEVKKSSKIINYVQQYISAFINWDATSICVIVRGTKLAVKEYSTVLPECLSIIGDNTTDEKLSIIHKFGNDISKRVLVGMSILAKRIDFASIKLVLSCGFFT